MPAKRWHPAKGDRVRMITDVSQAGTLILVQRQGHLSPEGSQWYVEFDTGSPRSRWVWESDIEPEVRLIIECPCGVEHLTPMHYYVTVRDGDNANRIGFLAGPFREHSTALDYVDPARKVAVENSAWNHFHSYGTTGVPLTHGLPGLFNGKLGLDAAGRPEQPKTQPPAGSGQEGVKAARREAKKGGSRPKRMTEEEEQEARFKKDREAILNYGRRVPVVKDTPRPDPNHFAHPDDWARADREWREGKR